MNLVAKHKLMLESANFAPLSGNQVGYMAQLLENQDREIKLLKESGTLTADVAQYLPILVPIIRRTYPALMANTIAGVQAMNAPSGAIFALTGRLLGKGSSTDVVTPTNAGQVLVMKDDTHAITEGTTVTGVTDSNAEGKVVYVEGNKILVKISAGKNKFKAGEQINTDKEIVEVYSNEAGFQKILTGYTGPVEAAKGEIEGKDMKEIGIVVEKIEAKAGTRNLKGRYTLETMQDLKSLYSLDAEKEIMTILSNEVQLEIDTEVRNFVNNSATQLADFSVDTRGRWDIEKLRALTLKIANEAREISRTSRRGPGNVLLVSPKIATALEAVGNFVLSPAAGKLDAHGAGIQPTIGKFDNRYTVAVDNFADSDYFTVLYKGSDKDTGVFFAPYIGLSFVKVVDPETANPSIILKCRYDILENPLGADSFARTAQVDLNGVLG